MSRRTRSEYRANLPLPRRNPPPKSGFLAFLKREIKRRAIAAGHIVDPRDERPRFEWEYLVLIPIHTPQSGLSYKQYAGFVRAQTKSEVRAILKRELKMKLPPAPYTRIERA